MNATGAPDRPWRERVAVALHLLDRRDEPPSRVVVIAATPRSGSSMLCRILTATGALGPTYEVLNHRAMLKAAFRWGVPHMPIHRQVQRYRMRWRSEPGDPGHPFDEQSVRRYLHVASRRRRGPDGTYGVKILGVQFQRTMQRLGIDVDVWGAPVTWIHLRRRDVLAQAVSLSKAHQTRQFSAAGKVRGTAHYDADSIRFCLSELGRGNAVWDTYFADHDITPIDVWYEDLAADPEREIRRVLDAIGRPDLATRPPTTARQFDDTNAEWIERFRQESEAST